MRLGLLAVRLEGSDLANIRTRPCLIACIRRLDPPPRYGVVYPPRTRCPLEALVARDFFLSFYLQTGSLVVCSDGPVSILCNCSGRGRAAMMASCLYVLPLGHAPISWCTYVSPLTYQLCWWLKLHVALLLASEGANTESLHHFPFPT